MLIRLIYLSKSAGPQTAATTDAILRKAQAWNSAHEVTGVLCQGQGVYLQVLEGERRTVTDLYARIFADPRHCDLELLYCECTSERRYGDWSMALVNLSDVDPETRIDWPEFNPYSASGAIVMARVDELLVKGKKVLTASR